MNKNRTMISFDISIPGSYNDALRLARATELYFSEIAKEAPDTEAEAFINYGPSQDAKFERLDDHGGFFTVTLKSGRIFVEDVPII